MSGQAMMIALLAAGLYFGGKTVAHETNKHVLKPVYHHAVQPVIRVFKHSKHSRSKV